MVHVIMDTEDFFKYKSLSTKKAIAPHAEILNYHVYVGVGQGLKLLLGSSVWTPCFGLVLDLVFYLPRISR